MPTLAPLWKVGPVPLMLSKVSMLADVHREPAVPALTASVAPLWTTTAVEAVAPLQLGSAAVLAASRMPA